MVEGSKVKWTLRSCSVGNAMLNVFGGRSRYSLPVSVCCLLFCAYWTSPRSSNRLITLGITMYVAFSAHCQMHTFVPIISCKMFMVHAWCCHLVYTEYNTLILQQLHFQMALLLTGPILWVDTHHLGFSPQSPPSLQYTGWSHTWRCGCSQQSPCSFPIWWGQRSLNRRQKLHS